ncbi:unnamed protein product [marine sediment metagenome]|uniref:Uncharacterized protein n=1 Tax=marine sediment metagenome TaxID=412755 RepID=X0SX68_9ZZZZ
MDILYTTDKVSEGDSAYNRQKKIITQDVRQFEKELMLLASAIEEDVLSVIEDASIKMFEKIVERTPIDTSNARVNWNIGINGNDGSLVEYDRKAGVKDVTKGKKELRTRIGKERETSHAVQEGKIVLGKFKNKKSKEQKAITKKKIAKFRQEIKNGDRLPTITIFNNARHIKFLENGHSKQAPNGMISISIQDYSRLISRESKKYRSFK